MGRAKLGRPERVKGHATVLVALRLTQPERNVYGAEAKRAGLSLSNWMRAACSSAMSARSRRALQPKEAE
jgi:hypothetical protein